MRARLAWCLATAALVLGCSAGPPDDHPCGGDAPEVGHWVLTDGHGEVVRALARPIDFDPRQRWSAQLGRCIHLDYLGQDFVDLPFDLPTGRPEPCVYDHDARSFFAGVFLEPDCSGVAYQHCCTQPSGSIEGTLYYVDGAPSLENVAPTYEWLHTGCRRSDVETDLWLRRPVPEEILGALPDPPYRLRLVYSPLKAGAGSGPHWTLRDGSGSYVRAVVQPFPGTDPLGNTEHDCVLLEYLGDRQIHVAYELETGRTEVCQRPGLTKWRDAYDSFLYQDPLCEGRPLDTRVRPWTFLIDGTLYYQDSTPEVTVRSAYRWNVLDRQCEATWFSEQVDLYAYRPVPEEVHGLLDNPPYSLKLEYGR